MRMLQADVQVAEETLARKKSDVEFAKYNVKVYKELARSGAGREVLATSETALPSRTSRRANCS
jgi:hypothetical protein